MTPRMDPWAATEVGFAAALAPFAQASGFLVAVSGGPDSMALLRLTARWAKRYDHPPIHAATVDHRLRPDSRVEAETVAVWAKTVAASHTILTWSGERPVTRIQERARDARYRLLAEHAEQIGANVLLTAHHADDQAETVLFRLLRGSGIAGLAGMSGVTFRDHLRHARPLLGWSKAELVAFCEEVGQPYILDPSNADPRYARTRMRRLAKLLADEGFERDAILRLRSRVARAEAALAETTRRAQARLPAERSAFSFSVAARDLAALPDEIILRLVLDEVERIGEHPTPPRLERAETLLSRLLPALRESGRVAATLGGTVLRVESGRLTIAAEQRRHAAASTPTQHGLCRAERKIGSAAAKTGRSLGKARREA